MRDDPYIGTVIKFVEEISDLRVSHVLCDAEEELLLFGSLAGFREWQERVGNKALIDMFEIDDELKETFINNVSGQMIDEPIPAVVLDWQRISLKDNVEVPPEFIYGTPEYLKKNHGSIALGIAWGEIDNGNLDNGIDDFYEALREASNPR